MAIDTQVESLVDMRLDFQFRLREVTGVTATDDATDRTLNTALHDIHIAPGNYVPWAVREASLTTHPPYTTGTVTIDVSSSRTAVTGTSTLWTSDANNRGFNNARVGGKITFADSTDRYRITAVGGATSITLGSDYIPESDLAASSAYKYYEDEYALASDFFRPVDMTIFSLGWSIPLIGQQDFKRRFPRNSLTGRPTFAALRQIDYLSAATPELRILLSPAPDKVYAIPYDYITTFLAVSSAGTAKTEMVADADEPIIPVRYRSLIVLHALYNWYRDRKDDNRTQLVKQEYIDLYRRMKSEMPQGQDKPRIVVNSYFSRIVDRGGRRFNTGTEFDELKI